MGQVLGMSVSQFPLLRMKPADMTNILKNLMRNNWQHRPAYKDPANWPQPMRRDWADDAGLAAGIRAQAHQIEQFRKLRAALDAFSPDCVVMLYRDMGEPWGNGTGEPGSFRPPYWIHDQDAVVIRPYQAFAGGANYWDEDPETGVRVPLHREAAAHLIDTLQAFAPAPHVCAASDNRARLGLGHNCVAGIVHLDWDRRRFDTPILPIAIDPFGFNRARNVEGLSDWDKSQPPPLTPPQAFALGQTIASAVRASPWKVAIVASNGWSSSQNTARSRGPLHPDHDADRARFAQWQASAFGSWGKDWSFQEMEDHAQWEVLVSIVLAGAMSEIGAQVRHADLATNWILNANWVTTIFDPR